MDGSVDLGGAQALGIVVVGHVDHGKSTLIGRLLHETASLPDGKVAELEQMSEKRGMPFEWSFVLDAFQAERDQAVTIDTTQIRFASKKRPYVIIDAPGHREFLKNMISGAAAAEAAVLVIDAVEGLREQTRRHAYLLKLLGLGQVVVAVNKMDRVEHSHERFDAVSAEIESYLGGLGLAPSAVVPIAARHGDNLAVHSGRMPWYVGPTLVEALDRFAPVSPPVDRALRLPVQDVYKFDERRIIVGRVETGRFEVGDTLLFSPSGRTATVRTIESWGPGEAPTSAQAGDSVGFTLDEQIFVERGDIASHPAAAPALTHEFRATVFWLSERPLVEGQQLRLRLATDSAAATVESIDRVIDTGTLASRAATTVQRNDIAEVTLRSRELLALDEARLHPATGRFVLNDGYDTVAGGVINIEGQSEQRRPKSANLFAVGHLMTADARAWRNGHQGGVIWMTGLSGAGKSTLAMQVEQRLFAKGLQTYVLDGDNIRRGLNADLGFAPADRVENIRRVGEVAGLFANAGLVAITAFISPYRADRDRARAAAAKGRFHEIYVKADLATCEKRDPKGLYKRARSGEIPDFTGISAPYEAPVAPELVVDTAALSIDQAVDLIVDYIERTIVLRSGRRNGAALAG